MTQREMIKQLITSGDQALCDDCIAELLGFSQRQTANQYARLMNAQGEIKRSQFKEQCDRCKAIKLVNRRI